MRTTTKIGRLAVAVALLGPRSLAPHPIAAQQVGVFAVGAASDQEGYRRPAGAGVSVAFRPLSWISVRVDAARTVSEARSTRTFCDQYWPDFEGCADERGLDRTRAFSGGASIRLLVADGARYRVEGGGGVTRFSLNNAVTSLESPRSFGPSIHGGATSSFMVLAAEVRPFRWEALATDLEVRHAPTLRFRECWTDSYQPFCGNRSVTEVRLGLSYDLSRR